MSEGKLTYDKNMTDTAQVFMTYRASEDKFIVWGLNTFRRFDEHDEAVEFLLDRADDILATSDFWMTED